MYRIAVLDDEKKILDQIELLLKNYSQIKNVEFELEKILSKGDVDVERVSGFDIVILDINMPGINGLQIAKRIRNLNSDAIIIFCTNYAQYSLNGYEVSALGYIIKPITEYSFFKNMDRAVAVLRKRMKEAVERDLFTISNASGQVRIDLNDLVYVEIIKHDLTFYVLENEKINTYRMRGAMYEMCEKLEKHGFARCYVSYLVNLNHVVSVNKQKGEIKVTGGNVMPLSRKFQKSFLEQFLIHCKS